MNGYELWRFGRLWRLGEVKLDYWPEITTLALEVTESSDRFRLLWASRPNYKLGEHGGLDFNREAANARYDMFETQSCSRRVVEKLLAMPPTVVVVTSPENLSEFGEKYEAGYLGEGLPYGERRTPTMRDGNGLPCGFSDHDMLYLTPSAIIGGRGPLAVHLEPDWKGNPWIQKHSLKELAHIETRSQITLQLDGINLDEAKKELIS